jgi:CRP-like cAMP-binding protein
MRQGPQSASMNNLLCDYKIGFSANANKMDVRQTKLNIINNISSSKAIEREGGSAKLSFYRDLSRKGEKFMNPERPQSQHPSEAKHRPMTAITRTTEARPFSTSEMTNWKTMSPRNIDLTEQPKPKNPNLPGHYQRTMTANSSQKKRTTSAFAIKNTRPLLSAGQVRPQTGVHVNYPVREISVEEEESSKVAIYKPEIPALTTKNRDTKINRQKSMHENETRGSNSPILSPNSRASPSKKKGNFKKFSKVQEKDESSVDSYTRRMEAERPINYDETRLLLKRIEQDLGELVEQQSHVKKELLKEQREEFTRNMQGEPAALEPMMPWERVSIYMPDDPEFNSPLFKGEFVRPPILEIKPKDELEVQQLMDEVHERYNYFVKSCEVKHDTEYKFLKTSPDRLTVVELEKIQAQYDAKTAGQPFDVNLVESIVTPLPFFMKFDSDVRHKLLYKAQMATYPNGHVLFRQGDFGDKMYVILSGSANVVIHYNDPVSGKPTDRIVAWMKDGSSFGEYSMLGTKSRGGKDSVFVNISRLTNDLTNRLVYLKRAIIGQQEIDLKANNPVEDWKKMKEEQKELALGLNNPKPKPVEEPQTYVERTKRAADIIATEELTVLELSRDYFKEVILLTIKDEYERKIKLLSELPLFKAHEFMSLMPIVNFLQRKEYKLGQTVLKQGDPLNGFFMIYEGRCKIVYICSHKRKKEVSMHVKGLKSKLPKFCFGNERTHFLLS